MRTIRLLSILMTIIISVNLNAQNCDPWIIQAYKQLYNRNPNTEECNIRNYNNGSWNNYSELVGHIKSYNNKKTTAASNQPASCDPWIIQAYKQLYNRNPNTEECNIRNYNNGSWNNYSELVSYIKAYKNKNAGNSTPVVAISELKGDPWISKAYKELFNRQPNAWELNVKNYNNGSWRNYAELKNYVKEFHKSLDKLGVSIKTAESSISNQLYVVFEKNGKTLGIDIVNANGGNVVASGGANVIAAGGGNVIAAGGGNVVSAGGANFQITNNMAGISFGSKYSVQSAGTTIVPASGQTALIFR